MILAPIQFNEEENERHQQQNEENIRDEESKIYKTLRTSSLPTPPETNVSKIDVAKAYDKTAEQRNNLNSEMQQLPTTDALRIRYESTLERQFYRALVMLAKLREARNGFVSQKD
jgi:hypothetical protein